MTQKTSGEPIADGDKSIGSDSKLTNEIHQKTSKRDSIANIWGDRTPFVNDWPIRVDEQVSEDVDRWVQSACVLCSNGCGIEIGTKNGHIVGVRGLGTDRVNHGRLGPKGLHGWVANNSEDRLKVPYIRENGKLRESTWEEAMLLIVKRTNEIREKHTSNAIAFYTTGQLFLEEYYTLGVLGKAGLGTPHMDGNTRLCTATSAAALKLSFGSDGQPGSYTDLDTTDAVLLVGHNMASQQTVLWTRILDRLEGPNPPKLVVIDPRFTHTAEKAEVHLAPKVGTNVAVLNGLLNLIIQAGHIDQNYIDQHSIGFEDLKTTVSKYTPEKVEEITGIPVEKLTAAAKILGSTKTLVSTALQGVYQSMQASAAAVQINNIHIIRGLIGKKGCGIYQMNGQPTAQNTRETGADGDLPGFRNWENLEHINQLAKLWNVDEAIIPHWAPPTHAMQIFHYIEKKMIKMLWISGTNPAVSLPQLSKIRKLLKQEELFVIVQDAFLTETTSYADVVLPAALWGEKTGCFTNVDRTVHLSMKAVEPPGAARSDLDIFLDYAKKMDFRDKDNQPLIKWTTAEEAFEAWKECTRGRPCDYTGMSYEKLSKGTGIQWPCNDKYPNGAEHLYTDGIFNTSADYCETYGHDMVTGAEILEKDYKANDPKGKAIIRSADYQPPHEIPNKDYPLWLTTGRVVYHFHTRTKTGRSKELNEAAPDAFVQLSEQDAATYGIANGDMVKVESARGEMYAPAIIGNIIPGLIFIPFHYGYWDNPGRKRAANELTIDEWDPVSKQPHFKYGAVRIKKAEEGITGIMENIKDTIVDFIKKD
ncbi:MAG: molybdopterin oxidoreductase family protein [Candidatus Saccharibacteria bacterium]